MSPLPLIKFENGIEIEGLEFALDPHRMADFAFVSHGHSDHARKHRRVVATVETALMYAARYPQVPVRALPMKRKVKFGKASVELFPSGHMLGAAQILIEVQGARVVYTGDFKVYPNLTCPTMEARECDILIMESTYGDPAYSFPPQNEVYARIVAFVKRAVADGYLPVLVGYAMGKSQEAILLMQQQGYAVACDKSVNEINHLYRKAGLKLGPTEHYLHAELSGKVVVVSPHTLRDEKFKALPRKRSLFLSGWSQGGRGRNNFGTDFGVPLSDHADFTQLIAYIDRCKPCKIYTLHGEPKFAQILREMGYDAEFLHKGFRSNQAPSRTVDLTKPRAAIGENLELF